MAKQLLIRIYNNDRVDYLVQTLDGHIELSGSAFHEDQLPTFPTDANVSLIVPGEDVLLLELTMPKTSRTQLLKAIPYALEEQLIDNVEDLHFVASKQDADGNLFVAIVKQKIMQQWCERCQHLGLYPQIAVPDYLAVPLLDNQWHLYLDTHKALLRRGQLQGMTIEQDQLNEMLQLSLSEDESNSPDDIFIDYDDDNEHFSAETLNHLKVPVKMADEDIFCLQLFSEGLKTYHGINLLQGTFAFAKPKNKNTIIWKVAGILLVTWFALWFIGHVAQYFTYKTRLKTAQIEVATLYKQAFPQSQAIVSPRLRIERALEGEQSSGSGGIFLNLLTSVGQQMSQQKATITIQNFNYRDSILTLSLTAENFQTLAALSQALEAQGLSVQQQNASTKGKIVTARFIVKGKGNG